MSTLIIDGINWATFATTLLIILTSLGIGLAFLPLGREWLSKSQTNVTPYEPSTWRLSITTFSEIEPYSFRISDLRVALERKFNISLAESKLSLAPQGDRHCATLTLLTSTSLFVNGKSFDLEVDRTEGRKIRYK